MTPRGLVHFQDVWKKYLRGERHDTLRDLIPATVRRLIMAENEEQPPEAFWGLREVSFEVEPGQALGVIGPNGAGKSTVLKLASGILEPDHGAIEVRGRIGALIEVVAGFHHELTGRENIYLQGAVMGMRRKEIDRVFDEIVEFSGVSAFLDTPVKRYSSGMSARLGFSIAAHMEPDVLLIDEVLAVGDSAFQRRALERLQEILARDICVILVSHQLDRVVELCDRAILLMGGRVAAHGSAVECVTAYVEGSAADGSCVDCPVILRSISGPEPKRVRAGERVSFTIRARISETPNSAEAAVGVRVREVDTEQVVFATNNRSLSLVLPSPATVELGVSLEMNVASGLYRVQAVVWHFGRRVEWASGPSALVRVEGSVGSFGPVFMSPRLAVIAAG